YSTGDARSKFPTRWCHHCNRVRVLANDRTDTGVLAHAESRTARRRREYRGNDHRSCTAEPVARAGRCTTRCRKSAVVAHLTVLDLDNEDLGVIIENHSAPHRNRRDVPLWVSAQAFWLSSQARSSSELQTLLHC